MVDVGDTKILLDTIYVTLPWQGLSIAVGDTKILLDTIYVNPPWQGLSW